MKGKDTSVKPVIENRLMSKNKRIDLSELKDAIN